LTIFGFFYIITIKSISKITMFQTRWYILRNCTRLQNIFLTITDQILPFSCSNKSIATTHATCFWQNNFCIYKDNVHALEWRCYFYSYFWRKRNKSYNSQFRRVKLIVLEYITKCRILCFSSNDTFVEKHFVDKIFVEAFCRQNFVEKHFVDKIFVGAFCRQNFVEKHFVDRTFRRHDILSTNFRRQNTSSTEHFVGRTFRRQNTSSAGHFVDKTFCRQNIQLAQNSLIRATDFRPHPHPQHSMLKLWNPHPHPYFACSSFETFALILTLYVQALGFSSSPSPSRFVKVG
jgi:hypothetical protein